jgi:hypothetical protein
MVLGRKETYCEQTTILKVKDYCHNCCSSYSTCDNDDGVAVKYGIYKVDSTVILDSNGKPVFMDLSPSGYEPLKNALVKVMV